MPPRTARTAPFRRLSALSLLAAAALLLAPPARAQEESTVSPGDLVRVIVHRNPGMSGDITVAEDGTLLHPLYRGLQVTGLTRAQLDQRIGAHLARYEAEPSFVVEPLVRVTVAGEVRTPQIATVPPATTVMQVVAQAGGINPTGRPSRVELVRGGQSRSLDLTQANGPGATERVRSGDLILVGRRPTWVRDVLTPVASVTSVAIALINLLR